MINIWHLSYYRYESTTEAKTRRNTDKSCSSIVNRANSFGLSFTFER